ncbi:MAG: DUF523 and DUF1722 domain-containing protein [Endomicrobia bacterium]|nr:DUF523 and DUF1722 domain-containing protein [Endomicrobiia bacterium]
MKPTIGISACLNGFEYRYNGTAVNDEIINKIKSLFNLVNVCPEVEIGLGIPRKPIRLHKVGDTFKVIQEDTKADITEKLEEFSHKFIRKFNDKIHGFILKAKSPSCGIGNCKYYVNDKPYGRTYGVFARIIKEFLPYLPITDEGRLKNKNLLWEFLTKVFMLFRFQNSKSTISELIEFHTRHKYIFMCISQKHLKIMGNLLAQHKKNNLKDIQLNYEETFKDMLKLSFKRSNIVNTLTHIFGHLSNRLTKIEKQNFLRIIRNYKNSKIELSSVIEIFKIYALRFDDQYLIAQHLLNPFPEI